MKVKIDTKEKFHVITLEEKNLSANMTEELNLLILPYLQKEVRNVVLKFHDVEQVDEPVAHALEQLQQTFYENQSSFVICEIQQGVELFLDEIELLELLNITPTESEAWDIVQMEEIERELF